MGVIKEPLSGGLVTSRAPDDLQPGELTLTDNLVYQPWDNFLHSSPGVSTYSTAFASGVSGLVSCSFDSGDQYLIAQSNAAYWTTIASASAFATADAVTEGTTLDAVPYNNKIFLLNGANKNRVFLSDGSFRAHGMQPVTATPDGVTASGTWSQSATGYFEYWTTEAYVASASGGPENVDIESTFTGDPKTVFVGDTSTIVVVSQPIPVNDGTSGTLTANRWRVYRSSKKTTEGDVQFPSGFLVADLPIDTAVFSDGSVSQSSYEFVSATASNTGWTNPLNASADDGAYATCSPTTGNPATVVYSLATFSGVTDPVQGIEVEVQAKFSALTGGRLQVSLSWDGGTTYTAEKAVVVRTTDTITVLGGAAEKWGRDWSAGEFTSSTFRIKLRGVAFGGTPTISVDYVKCRLNYDGTANSVEEDAFPAVIFEAGGSQIQEGAYGPPPIAFTGDIYEDSLVVNDIAHPSFVRYSMAGLVESFPDKYFIDVETPERDVVENIKSMPGGIVVGCGNSLWRINYLPRDTDATFDRGKALEILDPVLGIVGPRAAARLRGPGGRTRLAAVSSNMLFGTDAFSTEPLSDEIDWPSEVSIADISNAILLNNSANMELLLLFPLASGNTRASASNNAYMYHFSYHPNHVKANGRLKISGPTFVWVTVTGTNYGALSACTLVDANNAVQVYLGYPTAAARVATLSGTNANKSDVRTRQLFLAGDGQEWATTEAYVHHKAATGETSTLTVYNSLTGAAEATDTTATFTPSFYGRSRVHPEAVCEGARIGLTHTPVTNPVAYDYVLLRAASMGREDSGK